MKKVLHVFKTYYPATQGGVENVIYNLAEGTRNYGFDSSVLTVGSNNTSPKYRIGNHEVVVFPQSFSLNTSPVSVKMLRQFIYEAEKFDIVHYHYPWPWMDICQLMSQSKIPYVVTYHSDILVKHPILKLYKPFEKRFLTSAAKVIATSVNYQNSSLNLKADNVAVVPLGIPEYVGILNAKILKKFSVCKNPKQRLVVSVGSYRHYKGYEKLIANVAKIDAQVLIVTSAQGAETLRKMSKNYDVSNLVILENISDEDKFSLLKVADLYICTSDNRAEAFGVSLLEAAMMSLPSVIFELSTGSSYVVQDKVTGEIVPNYDWEQFISRVNGLLYNNDILQLYGNNARNRFKSLFTVDNMAKQYVDLYNSIIA